MTLSRRTFVRVSGLAGILAAARPPAAWAARELTLLTAVNYAPTSDVKLAELGRRFTKATGITVRTDHMQSVQMPAKLSAELMSQGGHDIVTLEMHYPWLFAPGLADVSGHRRRPRGQARRLVSVREGARVRQGPVARCSLPLSVVSRQPPHRPVREGR
jgi:hypothetical protein